MKDNNKIRPSEDAAFQAAWRLFCTLHDAPSRERAEALVRWLGRAPQNACALDEVLTLWALSGAALLRPSLRDPQCGRGRLQ
jgi:ferric-dicitrate binding protein FerR (iron transport regulator)